MIMTNNNWIKKLKRQHACAEGIEWASSYSTPQAAWNACEDAKWMLWAWGRNCGRRRGSESHRKMVLCCVEIARTSLKYIEDIEDKEYKKIYKTCLSTTEKWAKRENGVTLTDVKKVIVEIDIYHDDVDYAASHYAARAAYYDAALDTTVAWAASVLWDAAASYTWNDETKTLNEFANMIRKIQPKCPKS